MKNYRDKVVGAIIAPLSPEDLSLHHKLRFYAYFTTDADVWANILISNGQRIVFTDNLLRTNSSQVTIINVGNLIEFY